MAIQVTWDNPEKTILRWEFQKGWTLEEFFIATRESADMVEQTDTPFYLLVNGNGYPAPSLPMASFRSAIANTHPRMKRMIITSSDLFTKAILELLKEQGSKGTESSRLVMVETIEEAYTIINQDQ
ncbi:MAG: hypothetical protein ACOYLB_03575 [Phototrophicaceae bacterium]